MKPVNETVRQFFEAFETQTTEPGILAERYEEVFLFAGPQGAQAVQKAAFLQAIPKRAGFFKALGLVSSTIRKLEETRLDEHYRLVKAYWQMRFEPEGREPLVEDIAATYLLHQQADELRIVLQLDHQDLLQRVRALGLLPAQG